MPSFSKVLDNLNPEDGRHVLALLRSGLRVDLRGRLLAVLGEEGESDLVDSHDTQLLDVLPGGEIVLQQAEPPVLGSRLGAAVELSSIVRGDQGPFRLGVRGLLVEVRPCFRLGPEQVESVFLVKLHQPVRVRALNVRLGVRVDLNSQSLLSFSAHRLPVYPTNISVGGVGFNCPKDQIKHSEQLHLDLDLQGRKHPVRVKVVRVQSATNKHDYVGGQFLTQEQDPGSWRKVRDLLQARIMAEQARQIAKDKGVV